MYKFSDKSLEKLSTCDQRLQYIFKEVIKHIDCTILEGYRSENRQRSLYVQKRTLLNWPDSKHNVAPSKAVDVCPYPIVWDDTERFFYFAGFVKGIGEKLGHALIWGGDWDGDAIFEDQQFNDYCHFQLKE